MAILGCNGPVPSINFIFLCICVDIISRCLDFFCSKITRIRPSDETIIKTVYIAEYYHFSVVGNIKQNRITKANKNDKGNN